MLGNSIVNDGLRPMVLDLERREAVAVAGWALLNERYHSWAPDSSGLAITVGAGRSAQVNK